MWNLFRAEWTKTYKRPANIGLLLITLAIILITFVAQTGIALYNGKEDTIGWAGAQFAMMFPNGFLFPSIILSAIGSMLAVVFMGNSIGSEYSRDTWKVLLPRRARRSDFIIVKIAICLLFMICLIIISLIFGQLMGLIGAAILGGTLFDFDSFSLGTLLKSLIPVLLQLIVFSSITLLVTMAGRSTIMGIVFGIVGNTIFNLAMSFSTLAAKILPNAHISNLEANWLYTGDEQKLMFEGVDRVFGTHISLSTSLMVVGAYIFGSIILGILLFQRRDMAGQ